mgnify:CR=1 FL=1
MENKCYKYKVCIFDLDGTITDSVGAIAHTANQTLELFGLAAQPVEAYKQFAGDGQYELIKRALTAAGDENLACYEKAMPKYIELFRDGCTYGVTAFDGIKELLGYLKEKGCKIAVLSNKHQVNTTKVVETVFGKNYFDVVMGQSDTCEKKPSPQGAWMIAEKFGLKPEECLYFGDTDTDMKTGKNAGMDTVGVTWGFRSRQELKDNGAKYIVDEPKEIMGIV